MLAEKSPTRAGITGTIRASPDSEGSHSASARVSRTVWTLPDRVASRTISPASPRSASRIAVAIDPVPHASVSPSTPRS